MSEGFVAAEAVPLETEAVPVEESASAPAVKVKKAKAKKPAAAKAKKAKPKKAEKAAKAVKASKPKAEKAAPKAPKAPVDPSNSKTVAKYSGDTLSAGQVRVLRVLKGSKRKLNRLEIQTALKDAGEAAALNPNDLWELDKQGYIVIDSLPATKGEGQPKQLYVITGAGRKVLADAEKAAVAGVKEAEKAAADKIKNRKLSLLDAAVQVLEGSKESLNPNEIVDIVHKRKLWHSDVAKTPAASLRASIIREIAALGKKARFVKTEPGKYAFNKS